MRKQNQEIKDKKTIDEILRSAHICRLAMSDGDIPYLLPFNYGYKDNHIFIHSAPEGKKIDLLKQNNKVCFEIEQAAELVKGDKACKWTTRYRSVIGYGEVDIITDEAQKKQGLDIIMTQHGGSAQTDYEKRLFDRMVILKMEIISMTGKQSSNW